MLDLFKDELILLDYEAKNKEDLLKKMSALLQKEGYVKDTFVNAILEREKKYPTGLKTPVVSIAIPHTDTIHVNKPAILFAKLKRPVIFKEMGNGENDVYVNMIFMLVIKNTDDQTRVLSDLMPIFSKAEKLEKIYSSNQLNKEVLKEIILGS